MSEEINRILVTGGAGYLGSALVPILLDRGYKIDVLDLMIFGNNVLPINKNLNIIKGDIRDVELLKKIIPGKDAVIHLACLSNDGCCDINEKITKEINFDSLIPLFDLSCKYKVKRFINTSTSSVYGLQDINTEVTEEIPFAPITLYNKYKSESEILLSKYQSSEFTTVNIRPATICGYAKRQRLDVVVNLLCNFAYNNRKITIFGGEQLRPNIHIKDLCEIFYKVLTAPKKIIAGQAYNSGSKNYKVKEIAKIVKEIMGDDVVINTEYSDDKRSYHINSQKIKNDLNFKNKYSVKDAVIELKEAFENKLIIDSLKNNKFNNLKLMEKLDLSFF